MSIPSPFGGRKVSSLHPTYGRRRGRKLRAAKRDAVDALLPELQIEPQNGRDTEVQKENLSALLRFRDPALLKNLWLEIGFGSGEHLLAQARANPDAGLIGCEPYVNGLGNLLQSLVREKNPLSLMTGDSRLTTQNLRLYLGDARELMMRLPDACLSRVFILFPDPWPKARHHKRRLIQEPFLSELARVMKPAARLRLATDHADYLAWMLERLLQSPHFEWTARRMADWAEPPPDWTRTRYQEKAEAEGRAAAWLDFSRNE